MHPGQLLTAVFVVLLFGSACEDRPPLRVATFNIENYPKNEVQKTRAIDVIDALDADIVAVQEITDPVLFARQIATRLGERWSFVYSIRGPRQKLGVVFDRSKFELVETIVHDETEVRRHAKPTLEVRLRHRERDAMVRTFVVHLKAGGDHFRTRAAQLWHLTPVIDDAVESGDDVLLLGDFNSTGWLDRVAVWSLAAWTGTDWNSQPLACTSYWQREEDCPTTPLDHIVSTRSGTVTAHGACESVGCDVDDRCPLWVDEVSDHCPVAARFP
jgi:endonuclease/exonuclease/phosphatase family metal-dependent hydrolase